MIEFTIRGHNWMQFYNNFQLRMAEMKEERKRRKKMNAATVRTRGADSYQFLDEFSTKVRNHFEPKLEGLSLPGLDKLGVVADDRAAVIYEENGEVVCDLFYIDSDGYYYSALEAKNPSIVMTHDEMMERAEEAVRLCINEDQFGEEKWEY